MIVDRERKADLGKKQQQQTNKKKEKSLKMILESADRNEKFKNRFKLGHKGPRSQIS